MARRDAGRRRSNGWLLWLMLWPCVASSTSVAIGAEGDVVTVRLEEGQTLRALAEEHLGDPDLWQAVLQSNGLSVADVRPGIELEIPVAAITEAGRALDEALARTQAATAEGARLFAPTAIADAIRLREQAVAYRQIGAWDEAAALADQATVAAEEALAEALAQRDATAEALLSDRQGSVEGQRPEEFVWSDRTLNTLLIEEEKVRTLSRSTAQITFRDASRLRLNANSQALIQRMRVDPLSRREEAKVSLVEGDFYALLAGRSERRNFELEVPEVETRIESTNFWVRRDQVGSKFTNYDERVLEVSAQGESVELGRNEATLVRTGNAPSDKIDILGAPDLVAPEDDQVAFDADVGLAWSDVPDSAGYWVELAEDPGFERMTVSQWGLAEARFEVATLDVGSYYWRVVALDKFGLPGERSQIWRFHVRNDVTPPYLSIGVPGEGEVLRESPILLRGESEPGATLELDGRPLEITADGGFEAQIEPTAGVNRLTVRARDAAGLVTERSRSFLFLPDERAAVIFDDGLPRIDVRHFVTAGDAMALAGQTNPNAQLVVRAEDGERRASAYANTEGRFVVAVPMRESEETFDLEVVTETGLASADQFQITVDRTPPPILLETPPPPVTAVEWLPLRGRVEGGVELLVDGRPTDLIDETFDHTVTLVEGANEIELLATDLVGNVTVEKLEIVLDQRPPELVRQSVSRNQAASGEAVTIEVVASDDSGMKQAASFRLQIGDGVVADFLRFDRTSQSYRSTILVPGGLSGRVALKDVELEDYAGNMKRYTFR